jgi:8-oxo-dGTP pyrophosphatase MutT (NUDIX family)
MRIRAVIVLIEDDRLALIERHRAGRHYFAFPGGGVDPGETVEAAAVREMLEETGLHVRLLRQVAEVWFQGSRQDFFLAQTVSGVFGTGTGHEILHPRPDDPDGGTYEPVWLPIAEILSQPVLPRPMGELVVRAVRQGWPEQPVVIQDHPE